MCMTRGKRNNNPANIRRGKSRWIGMTDFKSDKEFVQFKNMDYGLRAVMILIRNYIKNGFDTPDKIIQRFAPSCENDTKAYLDFVHCYVAQDLVIKPWTSDFYSLIHAICFYESAYFVYEPELRRIKKKFKL